jgi:transposase
MQHKYIGFDIDSKKTAVCVVQQGHQDRYTNLRTEIAAMQEYLQRLREPDTQLHLTFEIGGEAGYRYDALRPYVDTLTVSNPSQMTWIFRSRKKNDRIDARKQAVLLSIGEVPPVHMPRREIRQWRVVIQHRRTLVNQLTAVKNRIRAVLKAQGLAKARHPGSWWKAANLAWMEELSQDWTETTSEQLWRVQLGALLEQRQGLADQRAEVTRYLDGYLAQQPGGTLLMSIPGVGPRTAEAVLAYTDEIHRFRRTRQYCAYFGLTPKLDESGSVRHLGHISKEGPAVARWLLVESAWRALEQSPGLKAFYERVLAGQKNRRKIAIVATARKLLSIMRAMQKTGELFNEELVAQHVA